MRTSVRFAFQGGTPSAFVAVFILLGVNFGAGYALAAGFLQERCCPLATSREDGPRSRGSGSFNPRNPHL